MFEQSVVATHRAKPWTFAVSVAMEAAVIGTGVLISVVQLQRLDVPVNHRLMAPPLPGPHIEDVVRVIDVVREHSMSVGHRIFPTAIVSVPRAIPSTTPQIVDPPDMFVGGSGVGTGQSAASVVGPVDGYAAVAPPVIRIKPPVEQKAATAPPPRAPMRVSQGVQAAKLLKMVTPEYPRMAVVARVSGTVRLLGIIGKDGTIQNLQVVSGHPMLVPAALAAVKQWVYRPTLLSGEPTDVIAPIDVIFTLSR